MSAQTELIKCVRKYRDLDNRLKTLNAETYKLREERKIVELEMSDVLRSPNFATISRLEINDDDTAIKIQRPSMWTKAWSLSIKELTKQLEDYFKEEGPKSAAACVKFIVEKRKVDLVSTEFAFTRSQGKTDTEDA